MRNFALRFIKLAIAISFLGAMLGSECFIIGGG